MCFDRGSSRERGGASVTIGEFAGTVIGGVVGRGKAGSLAGAYVGGKVGGAIGSALDGALSGNTIGMTVGVHPSSRDYPGRHGNSFSGRGGHHDDRH